MEALLPVDAGVGDHRGELRAQLELLPAHHHAAQVLRRRVRLRDLQERRHVGAAAPGDDDHRAVRRPAGGLPTKAWLPDHDGSEEALQLRRYVYAAAAVAARSDQVYL